MSWRQIRPENDKNRNDVPDDVDKAITGYIIWECVKAILLILAVYSFFKLLGHI